MEATEYFDKKAEREQKIAALEAEKASLQSDIAAMKEKLEQLEFERSVRTLQGEIQALRTEKVALEENTHAYEAEARDGGMNKPSQPNIQTGPAATGNAGHVPTGQGKAEQQRPFREAVPGRNPNQQRPALAAGTPRTAGPVPTQAKPKVSQ